MDNPYAIYVNCDGAMDYDSANSGGIGFVIRFPDFVGLDPISASYGIFVRGNIEVLELQALISAFQKTSFAYAKWKINDYMSHYNNRRRHRSLKKLSPANYWTIMFPDFPIRPQTARSGEMVKGVDSNKNQTLSTLALPLTISERRLDLPEPDNQVSECQNQNGNSVQLLGG